MSVLVYTKVLFVSSVCAPTKQNAEPTRLVQPPATSGSTILIRSGTLHQRLRAHLLVVAGTKLLRFARASFGPTLLVVAGTKSQWVVWRGVGWGWRGGVGWRGVGWGGVGWGSPGAALARTFARLQGQWLGERSWAEVLGDSGEILSERPSWDTKRRPLAEPGYL